MLARAGPYIQSAENEPGLPSRGICVLDHGVRSLPRPIVWHWAPRAPPRRNADAENTGPKTRPQSLDESKRSQPSAPTIDQCDDPIREATRRRHDEECRGRCDRPGDEIRPGRKPRSRKVTRSVTMHTITLDISSANISRGLGVHARMLPGHGGLWRNPSSFADAATVRLLHVRCVGVDGFRSIHPTLNHSAKRAGAADRPSQPLKKR
jgi:hypothetical protein